MVVFLLKSSACLAVFLLFYKFLLEKERMHTFKRYYLLSALVLALVIPSITFVEYVTVESVLYNVSAGPAVTQAHRPIENTIDAAPIDPVSVLWIVYALGILFFGWKFVRNLTGIIRRIRNNPKHRMKNVTHVLLKESLVPHTFFRYIFLNKKKFDTEQIPDAVILHEQAHARQKHSVDILFIELLQVIFWFNPLFHLAKKSIKLNHEFLADQAVVTTGISSGTYQNLLLAFSSSAKMPELANSINYSSIKKRFTVMKTRTSKKSILIRTLFIAPLLAILLYGFSTTVQIPKEPAPVIVLQEGATKKQIGEYNTLANKYNSMLADDGNIRIKKSDVDRLEYLHGIMTEDQRAETEPFPDFPEPPQPPNLPAPPSKVGIEEQRNQLRKQSEEIKRQATQMKEQVQKIEQQAKSLQKQSLEVAEYKKLIKQKASEIEKEKRAIQEIIENQEIYNDLAMDKKTVQEIIENQNIYDSPSKGPGYFSLKDEDVTIYLNGREINYLEMMKMEKEGTITSMEVIKKPNGKSVIDLNKSNLRPPVSRTLPKPKSPLDHIKDMAKQDALFYYEGKEISSDKAIEITKNNDEINIDTRRNNDEKPIVRLSTAPIETEN